MIHVDDLCPLTKLKSGLPQVHGLEAEECGLGLSLELRGPVLFLIAGLSLLVR